ncbi:MAG: hypothetical protein R3175_04595 [Marinobacter sp.]|uniref:tetratricopeptide repeat protein n=1 Tax=Marinobacter sp. TaxID=50741 RepID=UPI00299F4445|nr:hypothetical protein [Marinobacter sp.]MDX1755320.1 hypothetical protein [Marinobacter sp.]
MKALVLMVSLWSLSSLALGGGFDDELLAVQQQWAHIQYELPEGEREKAFESLAEQVDGWVEANPQRPEALIWQGIVLSTYAGAKGGLGALSLVKQARKALESALTLNEQALEGSAHASLGSLYYQVPGWPLSFGDDDEAERHLQAALQINPGGIDPNFFFGDFLLNQGDRERARIYLEKALAAPDRPGRAVADAGRRDEIRARLAGLN